ncbi:MAG: 16S rRNA (cytosine(967)-C(5))-methyltransferase RsmB [Ruminococcus sp.]|nr:16S rRNA (cytosine(967)-C(5))-methyltransferase RsmB [Ruminococcus sp.]
MANARKTVLKLLTKLDKNSSYSNILLDDALAKSDLSVQDKKFASALFYGVLERRITLDAVIKKYSDRPADRLNVEIRNLLRMGIYQLCFMDSVPDSASVNESVKLAKSNRNPAISGFVNGLLRSFIRDEKCLPNGKNKIENLSIQYSCPEWLVDKWLNEYGEDVTLSMLSTSIGQPPTTIRVNNTKCKCEELYNGLIASGIGCEVNHTTDNALNIFSSGAVEKLEQYKNGMFHVQDISSQLCCRVVDPIEGDTVLDICSAPGGKTFTLAEIMNNKGEVLAFDLHENRVRLIKKGAERLGLSIVSSEVNNGKVFNEKLPLADKVLCDVPCSGLGVIRRKPEIKYKNPEDFENLPEIQYNILSTSSKYVKTGGIIVYSTCSLSRAENDDVVNRFLQDNPDFEPVQLDEQIFGKDCDFKISITPDKFNSDGFFIAKMIRTR